jgi:pantetheine-phosphate adenylyltransferase
MKVAIYPGTFDPITKGHIDIIVRSIKFVDKLIIAVSNNNKKNTLFKINERVEMVKEVLQDEKISNIEVDSFDGLLMTYASKKNANVIIRGLRAVSDFEYEFQMTGMNYKLNSTIETIFLMSSDKYQLISSKLIKEINSLNGDISQFVPKAVEKKIIKKVNN